MNIIKSMMMLCLTVFLPIASAQAEDGDSYFKNKDFLEMPRERQKFWLSGAIDTLAHVAFAEDEKIGQCIWDWYFKSDNAKENGAIIASFKKYPDHTPTTILIALTERECGAYVRSENNGK